jgi:hypothetical protein
MWSAGAGSEVQGWRGVGLEQGDERGLEVESWVDIVFSGGGVCVRSEVTTPRRPLRNEELTRLSAI